jgi:hypothetical protein
MTKIILLIVSIMYKIKNGENLYKKMLKKLILMNYLSAPKHLNSNKKKS